MRVISQSRLRRYQERFPDAERQLSAWLREVRGARWESPQDVKETYKTASFVANNRIIFNIKGNRYRLIVAVAYKVSAVYIKFFGTHQMYDEVDAAIVEDEL